MGPEDSQAMASGRGFRVVPDMAPSTGSMALPSADHRQQCRQQGEALACVPSSYCCAVSLRCRTRHSGLRLPELRDGS